MEGELRHALALNVRAFRKARQLSQEAFAELHGLQRTWVGAVERGERNLTLQSLERLAHRLGVPPLALLQPPASEVGPESPEAETGAPDVRGREVEGGGEKPDPARIRQEGN